MKLIYKITLLAAALIIAAGCSDDVLKTTYSYSSGFSFAAPVLNVEVSPQDNNSISVPIYRGDKEFNTAEIRFEYDKAPEGSSKSEWVDVDPDGIFSLTTQRVMFPDEAVEANAIIRFSDIAKMGIMDRYKMRLTIKDQLSPSNRNQVIVTVNRKLTFDYLGKCTYSDSCIFDHSYQADIYRAQEAEIYRVMDPYTEGLVKEEYAENGWMGKVPNYIQFSVDADGYIYYEPFTTGMLLNGLYMAWAYFPGEYQWGKDFSSYNSLNKKIDDKTLKLYPVYCLPDYQYGFLNDGVYPLTITLP